MLIRKFGLSLILLIAIVAYWPSLFGPFQYDDHMFIVRNSSIRQIDLFSNYTIQEMQTHSRQLTLFTFALNFHFAKLNPFYYHLTNLIIHLIVSVLIFLVTAQLFKTPKIYGKYSVDIEQSLPFWCALFFAVHPANTQAITFITQRFESLAALWYFLTVFLYLKLRLIDKQSFIRYVYLVFLVLSFICCVLSKETGFSLPFMILLIECVFFKRPRLVHILTACVLALLPVIYFQKQIHGLLTTQIISMMHNQETLSFTEYLLTQLRVFFKFLSLVFYPVALNIDPDIAKSGGLFNPFITFLSLLGILFIGIGAFIVRNLRPLVTFGVFYFMLVLSVNLVPRAFFFAEHKIYLAMWGILIVVLIMIFKIQFSKHCREIILSLIVLLFGVMTFSRNYIWMSEEALWKDAVEKSPNKSRTIGNLTTLLHKNGKTEEALDYLNKAIGRNPKVHELYYYRSLIYIDVLDFKNALNDLNHAVLLERNNPWYYMYRGLMHRRLGNIDLSNLDFNRVASAPYYEEYGYVNLAVNYALKKDAVRMFEYFHKVFQMPRKSDSFVLESYVASLYFNGLYEQALQAVERILAVKPNDPNMLAVKGNCYQLLGDDTKAIEYYLKSINSAPTKRAVLSLYNLYVRFDGAKANQLMHDYPDFNFIEPYDLKEINLINI